MVRDLLRLKVKTIFVVILSMVALVDLLGADPPSQDQAKKSAEQWLNLIDHGKFEESWKAAADYMQHAQSAEVWKQKLDKMRKPLGKVVSRELQSSKSASSDYFDNGLQLKFATTFENRKNAIETVTVGREKDGACKVAGYYIQ
jgi:hypothetical protein